MTWRDAVIAALHRLATRHGTRLISRQMLLDEELSWIVRQTESVGATPQQTLSRVLQELRDEGVLYFGRSGQYLLTDDPISIEAEDLPSDALDFALVHGRLNFPNLPVGDRLALERQRVGQARIRALTLDNYHRRCALCDIVDKHLLVASHVVRWSDDSAVRGNLANVICMCRLHDPLFEYGYFSLADDLSLIVRPGIQSRSIMSLLDRITHLQAPIRFGPEPRFLAVHRARVGLQGC